MRHKPDRFNVVEILIVLTVLGTITAIVAPHVSKADDDSKIESLRNTLRLIRSRIDMFKAQHRDIPPTALWTIMLNQSNSTDSDLPSPGGSFGPYLERAPQNPLNGHCEVGSAPSTTVGWVYTRVGGEYTIQAVDTTGFGVLTY